MKATGTFRTHHFTPTQVTLVPHIETALPSGVSTMEKTYEGELSGRSATLFTAAFDPARGIGTYIALEAFEGALLGREGAFNFIHSASTQGQDRTGEYFAIVPGSGTRGLEGIRGTGGLSVEGDGTHRIWFEFEL